VFETFESQVNLTLSIVTLIAIGISAIIYVYKKGKSEGADETTSDNVHDDLYQKVEHIESTVTGHKEQNDKEHQILFKKVDKISIDVAYTKGKIDQALKKS